jgi:hypothetical protein
VLEALDAFLNCGIFRHGCALACCQKCSHSELIAFSCKKRVICPSCDAKRSHIFAEHLHENILLPYPHKHTVFTIPIRLRPYFLYDRALFGELYKAAIQSFSEYIESTLPGKTAAVASLHSSGALLNWHPHIHAIVLAGTMQDDIFHPIEDIDTELLEEFFSEKVFQFLLQKQLLSEDTINSMQSWDHSGFKLWLGDDIQPDNQEQRLFISRYLAKCPVALNRIEIIENTLAPTIRYYKNSDKQDFVEMSPLEFLAKLSVHIPRVHERTSRFFGLYSYRTRGVKNREERFKALIQNNFEPIEQDFGEKRPPSRYWATWIKKVYQVDPLKCKRCGGELKIKSFVHDYSKIKKICESLGIPDWRAPPEFSKSSSYYIDTSPEFVQ